MPEPKPEEQKEKTHPHPEPVPPMMKILLDLTEKIGRLEGMMELVLKEKKLS